MLRRTPLLRTTRLKKAGKGAKKNVKALRVFKREMARLNIQSCEVRFKGCVGDYNLTWAHGRKRRKLLAGELETFAVVCCAVCHRQLDEGMSHEAMAKAVDAAIARRKA